MSGRRRAKCHPQSPHQAKGLCKKCYARQYRNKNREKLNLDNRNRYAAAPDKQRKKSREWNAAHKQQRAVNERAYRKGESYVYSYVSRKYGLSRSALSEHLEAQGGVCKICQKVCKTWNRLSVDHCHITGKVRGLLCAACNRGLSCFCDNAEVLRSAAVYLEEVA